MKPIFLSRLAPAAAVAFCAAVLQAATYYVDDDGSDANPGTLASPYRTIQKGVTRAAAGDTVLVQPGLYNSGYTTPTGSSKTRVVIDKAITVRSTQGAAATVIQGQKNSTSLPFGSASVRCVYMTLGTLDGFTLSTGYANASTIPANKDSSLINGGGVYIPKDNRTATVNNCIISGCGAYRGGGAYWGTLVNCTVVSNLSNSASAGSGGGIWGGRIRNAIVRNNTPDNYGDAAASVDPSLFEHSCTDPLPAAGDWGSHVGPDGGNIAAEPQFVTGTLRPAIGSPCVNSGNNAYVDPGSVRDAAGGTRIISGTVDMGAYENIYALYALTVINGSGDGNYTNSTVVTIVADPPPAWADFTGWTGDTAALANPASATTTVTMPSAPVTVTANYYTPTLSEILGDVLNLPQPVTSSNITADAVSAEPPEVRLGPLSDHESAFEASLSCVYTNAGTIIFPWRVSCELGWDRFVFSVDGVEQAAITGFSSGVVTQFIAGAGAHVLKWAYLKDDSAYDGDDAGWLEPVTWIPDDLAAELGAAGKPLAFPYGQPGDALPFPYGFQACFLDHAAPAGADAGAAVRLGGFDGGAPLVADNETTGVEAVLYGAGLLSFNWYTSSQISDHLICLIDGVEAGRLSGLSSKSGGWVTFTTNLLTVGAHTVRWAYAKDASGSTGLDCGWVDNVQWAQFSYDLTVENGVIVSSGLTSGTFAVGDAIAIAANPAPDGMEFDEWDGDTENLADKDAPNTTVTMPGHAIMVRAMYKVKTLNVAVINGRDAGAWPNAAHESTGEPEGVYPAGALVRIVADPAPLWQTFDRWTSVGGALFSNEFADVSMFVMPTNDVTITATYRVQTAAEKLAGALTIRGQPLVVTAHSPSGVVAEATGGIRYNDSVVRLGGPSVGPNQSAFLSTTNFTGHGYLLFWWHGDAEAYVDGVRLEVNGLPTDPLFSLKDTNALVNAWSLYGYKIEANVTNLTWRYTCDDTYSVHENEVLIDRVTWIPEAMAQALNASWFPNVNNEFDPLFEGRLHGDDTFDFEGEDGGVAWVHDAPGGGDAVRLGAFGYVTNNLLAQVSVTNWGTGILTWQWTTRSEGYYDRLQFLLDGAPTNWISGKDHGAWSNATFVVRTNPNLSRETNRSQKRVLAYRYKKDTDVSMFEDCGWMRGAQWMPTFALETVSSTNTAYSLPSPYNTIGELYDEAERGVFPIGTLVTVMANTPPPEFPYFDRWTGNGAALLNDRRNPNQTFAMPGYDVSLTATFTDVPPTVPRYALAVVNGAGSGWYTNGALVEIEANSPPTGYIFTGWVGNTDTVAKPSSAVTTVLMGTYDLVVIATYAALSVESMIPLAIGVPPPVTAVNIPIENVSQQPPAVTLGPLADGQAAYFECVYTNAGTVIFPWLVNSEEGFDFLTFSVDGSPVASISGEAYGTVTNFVAGDGPHVLRWSYSKDGAYAAGTDSGVIGTVTWIPDNLAAEFGVSGKPLYFPDGTESVELDWAPPSGAISNVAAIFGSPAKVANGSAASVEAVFSGAGNLSFQWRVSSEPDHDFLTVSVDGVEAARISGARDGWLVFETNLLTVASHVVRWTYSKDGIREEGLDCGWVDSVTWTQFRYALTIQNGSLIPGGATGGTFAVGDALTVTADAAPAGQEFDAWDGDTDALADPNAVTTTLVMPPTDCLIRALYKPVALTATVINGRDGGAMPNAVYESTGDPEGAYPEGADVRIIADPAPLWQTFDTWVSTNGAVFADAASPITIFTMPGNSVMVTATYRNQTEHEKLAGALTIAGQPLVITAYSPSGVVASATGGVRYSDPVVRLGGTSVGPGQSVGLSTPSFTGNGYLLYWWKSSSESRYDGVQLMVNGAPVGPVNAGKDTQWHLCTNIVTGATSIEFRFVRDTSYYVRDNTILVDRVTWIPEAMLNAVGGTDYVPSVNDENLGFSGEDGGVAWVSDAPGPLDAVRFGRFGYVNNSQHAQLSVGRVGTGIVLWQWASNSEADYDRLAFSSDGYTDSWISGKEQAWAIDGYAVTNIIAWTREKNLKTPHTFNYAYRKDGDVSVFDDCTWLRDVSWTPTVILYYQGATISSYTIPPQFTFLDAVLFEAAILGVYPQGTEISISANAYSGTAFAYWTGGPNIDTVLGADRFNASPTFNLPGHDFTMIPFYTNTTASPAPIITKQSKITGLTVQTAQPPALAAASDSGFATLAAAPTGWVELTFEGSAQTDYTLVWSPALVGLACQWEAVPASYREILSQTEDGTCVFRISAEIPTDTPSGFFRVEAR